MRLCSFCSHICRRQKTPYASSLRCQVSNPITLTNETNGTRRGSWTGKAEGRSAEAQLHLLAVWSMRNNNEKGPFRSQMSLWFRSCLIFDWTTGLIFDNRHLTFFDAKRKRANHEGPNDREHRKEERRSTEKIKHEVLFLFRIPACRWLVDNATMLYIMRILVQVFWMFSSLQRTKAS